MINMGSIVLAGTVTDQDLDWGLVKWVLDLVQEGFGPFLEWKMFLLMVEP
jgi:hypothetical protein